MGQLGDLTGLGWPQAPPRACGEAAVVLCTYASSQARFTDTMSTGRAAAAGFLPCRKATEGMLVMDVDISHPCVTHSLGRGCHRCAFRQGQGPEV
jgi:hypothetical protein